LDYTLKLSFVNGIGFSNSHFVSIVLSGSANSVRIERLAAFEDEEAWLPIVHGYSDLGSKLSIGQLIFTNV
jgi:hypothetical protein